MNHSKSGTEPVIWAILVLLIVLTASGCGNKTFPKPIQPIAPPEIVDMAAEVKDNHVDLAWTLSSPLSEARNSDKMYFAVLRSVVGPDDCKDCPPVSLERVGTLGLAKTQSAESPKLHYRWTDDQTAVGTNYRYRVELLDRRDRPISRSATISVALLPAPGAPDVISAQANPRGVLVQWQNPKSESKGSGRKEALRYMVERSQQPGQWTPVTDVPVQGTSFLDASVGDGTTYTYRITSLHEENGINIWGGSTVSAAVQAKTLLAPPPPQTVWVIPAHGKLQVYWTESEGKTGGYQVYRKSNGEIIRLTSKPVTKPPFLDSKAQPNAVYSYAVSAVSPTPSHEEGLLSKWVEFRNVTFQ